MIVRVLGERNSAAYSEAVKAITETGHRVHVSGKYDIAIAPLLTKKIDIDEYRSSIYGVLIFHPSPLPYGRGPSALKWAYKRIEPITAATWFWANDSYDSGDICEMEIVKIDHGTKPRDFYVKHIVPALGRTLRRALSAMGAGLIRRIPQIEAYSTYDSKL